MTDPISPRSTSTTFADWQTQLKLACEADRREDIEAIAALRPPAKVVLRHVTLIHKAGQTHESANGVVISGGARHTTYSDEMVSYETMLSRTDCSPLLPFPEQTGPAAPEMLHQLLRAPHKFEGSSLFWVKSVDALRLLEKQGADTHDLGWMGIPLLVFMAGRGNIDIVRFLIEERGHSPIISREDGGYTALHEAKGLNLVRYLIEQGGDPNALTHFGDSVLAQQVRSGQEDVVDYLLGLGEARATRANLLHWLDANPEMLRVLLRHGVVGTDPIEATFGEPFPPLALQRVIRAGWEAWYYAREPGDKNRTATALIACVQMLLDAGWNPHLYDAGGRLPYHIVQECFPDGKEPLRLLLDARLANYDGPRQRPVRKKPSKSKKA